MTNGDRIRSMTDEELMDIVICPHEHDMEWPYELCMGSKEDCDKCMLAWLRQPAEENQ